MSDTKSATGDAPATPRPALRARLPRVIFGTSSLGNLYAAVPHEDKLAVVSKILESVPEPMFDSAGKYGAGLALEEIGRCLEELGVDPDKVMISNKLAWKRAPLTTDEPTFEPGAWFGLEHDATQDISYEGMMACYEEGNALLGKYESRVVSVHDPDEYLAAASDDADRDKRRDDILGAYRALAELKAAGKVVSIGVGAKDITVIDWLADKVQLDWAMFACSITVYSHSEAAQALLRKLGAQGVAVINSAVFNAGFLLGGAFFDYRKVTPESDPDLFAFRDKFDAICAEFGVKPAAACVQFSFLFPEITSVALSTSKPSRVAGNIELASIEIPAAFWAKLKAEGLIRVPLPEDDDGA